MKNSASLRTISLKWKYKRWFEVFSYKGILSEYNKYFLLF